MVVDFHTHILPPSFRARREELMRLDATFATLFATPSAIMATGEELPVVAFCTVRPAWGDGALVVLTHASEPVGHLYGGKGHTTPLVTHPPLLQQVQTVSLSEEEREDILWPNATRLLAPGGSKGDG